MQQKKRPEKEGMMGFMWRYLPTGHSKSFWPRPHKLP